MHDFDEMPPSLQARLKPLAFFRFVSWTLLAWLVMAVFSAFAKPIAQSSNQPPEPAPTITLPAEAGE